MAEDVLKTIVTIFWCNILIIIICPCRYITLCHVVFIQTMTLQPPRSIEDAHVLLNLGDSVTTDHISPAGNIARTSAAARYLTSRG